MTAGIFRDYDIRGVYPDEINEENIYRLIQAHYLFFKQEINKDSLKVVASRDMRLQGDKLYPIIVRALTDAGAHVLDIGLAATPTFYFALLNLKADAGIQNTASHNPPEFTGLKAALRRNQRLVKINSSSGLKTIQKLYKEKAIVKSDGGIREAVQNCASEEISRALELVDTHSIKPLHVVSDTGNGMGITYLQPLFDMLPCTFTALNPEPDGTFPAHLPNPMIEENTAELRRKVVEIKADLGIATDGDADRMVFVTENGNILSGSHSAALVAGELLKEHPGAGIVSDLRYTFTLKKLIAQRGGKHYVSKSGSANVSEAMHKQDAVYGCESSGHVFFKVTGGAESQVLQLLYILRLMSESGKKLSALSRDIHGAYESGEHNFRTDDPDKLLEKFKAHYPEDHIDELDGISLEYASWRCNLRKSHTESLLRLNIEALTLQELNERLKEITSFIMKLGAYESE